MRFVFFIVHLDDMLRPSELDYQDDDLNVSGFCAVQDLKFSDTYACVSCQIVCCDFYTGSRCQLHKESRCRKLSWTF